MECAACFRVALAFASVVIGHRDGGANHGGCCHRGGRARHDGCCHRGGRETMEGVVIGMAVRT